eukprot:Nk52_evm1s957 gene=Nk52_evmTU1s957
MSRGRSTKRQRGGEILYGIFGESLGKEEVVKAKRVGGVGFKLLFKASFILNGNHSILPARTAPIVPLSLYNYNHQRIQSKHYHASSQCFKKSPSNEQTTIQGESLTAYEESSSSSSSLSHSPPSLQGSEAPLDGAPTNQTLLNNPIELLGASSEPHQELLLHHTDAVLSGSFHAAASSFPLNVFQYLIECGPVLLGMPWWMAIVSATFMVRPLVTLPLAVYQQRILYKMELLKPELQQWADALKYRVAVQSKKAGLSYEQYEKQLQKEFKEKRKSILKANNCSPIRLLLLPWAQIPLWILMSFSIRQMVGFPALWLEACEPFPGMSTGGALWFQDLTMIDPTMALPIGVSVITLMNIEYNATKAANVSDDRMVALRQSVFQNMFRGFAIMMLPIACQIPSGILLYWFTSGVYSFVQNIGTGRETFRKKFIYPPVQEVMKHQLKFKS